MSRKVVLDDAREDIQKTRVWKLLDYWVDEQGGNGLTANAICHLTNQPWKVVRHVLTEHTGKHQIAGQFCHEVMAPVFYPTTTYLGGGTEGYNILTRNASHLIDKSDAIIKKYPPSRYPGASNEKGQKVLTFFKFERDQDEEYDDDYSDRCDDPKFCPPRLARHEKAREKQAREKQLVKQNLALVKELKSCWK